MIVPFEDFIERTDALMAQFNTILDSVRTYLGIKQQKMSIMEQTSSKEQLVRLVNLQEILHKLEILIVAFYLTEMARIGFDTITHESANLLTVAFIPFALLISVLLIRALHKKRDNFLISYLTPIPFRAFDMALILERLLSITFNL